MVSVVILSYKASFPEPNQVGLSPLFKNVIDFFFFFIGNLTTEETCWRHIGPAGFNPLCWSLCIINIKTTTIPTVF